MRLDKHEKMPWESVLGFGNGCDRHSHAGDSNGQHSYIVAQEGCREALDPLFIHSREVGFLKKNYHSTHNPFEGGACGFENGRHILQALSGLLLICIPDDLPGHRLQSHFSLYQVDS